MTAPLLAATSAEAPQLTLDEFVVPEETWCQISREWVDEILATHPHGTWMEMKFHPTDDQLARMGLPPADALTAQRYPVPTMVAPDGTTLPLTQEEFNLALAAYAGSGCLGIRPGAWLLLLDGGSVGWCSMAHVYGSPGSYQISTAGHCGNGGDVATVIAAVGNHPEFGVPVPILLDFGQFKSSTDGGIGNDKALIAIDAQYQHLVSPTMCFWGGPLGSFTAEGAVVAATVPLRNRFPYVGSPQLAIDPNPFLAQPVVHYGHGTGVGTGGTPRMGFAQHWDSDHFAFFGAITPGDSGAGANTLGGDSLGAVNEAAGIITHLYVDPSLKTGIGLMAGTRVTKVGTPTLGQIVPYPAPLPGAP